MHNVGSVFRTADAFLIEAVFLWWLHASPPHRDINKTALGRYGGLLTGSILIILHLRC
jgi:tRNA G18 (ribose-2'-O)-methylase SpoU